MAEGAMRIDRFLWFARLARTRSAAQGIAAEGHLRIDGRPVDRAHAAVRVGNILTFVCKDRVRVVRVEMLPARRGPPAEGRGCYVDLVGAEPNAARRDAANVSHQLPRD